MRIATRAKSCIACALALGPVVAACSASGGSSASLPGADSGPSADSSNQDSSPGADAGSALDEGAETTGSDSGMLADSAASEPDAPGGSADSSASDMDAAGALVDGAGPSADGSALFAPAEVARVGNWLNTATSGLQSYAYTNINKNFPAGASRDRLVDSIVGACAAFAPPLANWQTYCEAIIASEIVSESSYVPTEVVNDAYATENGSNDPTVGLLQIRFSSTVHDYNYNGPIATIEAIGCSWPAGLTTQADVTTFWRTEGGMTTSLTFMEDPACNIPLAAWYVFMNATGNGGANAVYASAYCAGQGVAGNVVDGLLSHLDGPAYPRPADATNAYPAGIKTDFTNLLGGLPSPDPFAVTLSPQVSQYCN